MYGAIKHGKNHLSRKPQVPSILEKIPIPVVMLSVLYPEEGGGGALLGCSPPPTFK